MVGLGGLDVADPLRILVIVFGQPGRWQRRAVVVVEIIGEADAVPGQLRLRQGELRPRRQVHHRTRRAEHVPVHEEKVHPRAVAILALAPGVTLLVPRPGLPADAAQGVAFVFGQGVPFVPGRMPELVEQPMFLGRQPGQQWRIQTGSLAGFGEHFLDRDEAIVLGRQHQGTIQIQHATTEAAAAGVTETGPDFVQRHAEFVITAATGAEQAPTQLGRLDPGHIAEHPITRRFAATQTLGGVEKADQATALVADVEKQLQPVLWQALKPGIATFETDLPDPAQGVRQALAGDIRHIE
ncbi:hypothetical protein D3C76_945270 [compost metagenome]